MCYGHCLYENTHGECSAPHGTICPMDMSEDEYQDRYETPLGNIDDYYYETMREREALKEAHNV